MQEQDFAILKGLVAVAWADGEYGTDEQQAMDGLLAAFGASEADAESLRGYAQTPRTIDDIPLTDLSRDDRRTLLAHAVLLSFVDGEQHEKERTFLKSLAVRLRIEPDEAEEIFRTHQDRARKYLGLLGA